MAGDLTLATLGRDVGAVAVLEHPLRRGACAGARSPTSRSKAWWPTAPSRWRTSRWCSSTAAGRRARGLLAKLRKLDTRDRGEVRRAQGRPSSRGSSAHEVRTHGSTIDDEAADFLVQAVGPGPAIAVRRGPPAADDFPGEPLTLEKVKRYFGGRAEAKSFAVADAAFFGRRAAALEELRWALDGGTAAGAGHLRVRRQRPGGGALQGAPQGHEGVRPRPRGGRAAVEAAHPARPVARLVRRRDRRGDRRGRPADADIKGAASDASYTLERLVLTIADLRDAR